ncbi:MAG TPA: nucleoside monophosphate kinase [Candidatus Magasanikbacteria bacterium]|jgi:adenylate kinase|nr:AAA family ATPase [Candidatus Magasanikbacteria bacterium]HQF57103.1 nucleoside monophosphate kinase [Candidatus Magasanikbacteria bacterium]HQL52881.1 nucleoside monophosphate kinase [Candidatus Magasanikbacteria bacterium]
MKKIIILMGVPGSGKGTQARILKQKFNYGHISTGDLLRALDADPDGDLEDKKMLADMKAGKLVADDLIYKLAFKEIEKYLNNNQGIVLDGAIRNVDQAKEYQKFFIKKNVADEVIVIEIKLSDETSWNRLTKRKVCPSCGFILPYSLENELKIDCPECGDKLIIRKDDNPDTIKKRIEDQGNKAIEPILNYYQELGLLVNVDGEKNIDKVDEEVCKILLS